MTTNTVRAIGPRKVVVWIARAISYLVYFYLICVEIILFIGFFLLLFGANTTAGFTEWAYRNLDRVMEPFRGIFAPIHLGTTSGNVESVFDTSVLFAMIIYGIIALAFSALIPWLSHRLRYLENAEAVEAAEAEAAQAEQDRLAAESATAVQFTAIATPVPPGAPPVGPPPSAPRVGPPPSAPQV